MAHQYLEQELICLETSIDDESLEEYIEEEEVQTMPISTVYSNKLIDLGLAIETEAQRKEEELYNLQGTSKDSSSHLEDVRASINYLQALSARKIKEELEAIDDEEISGGGESSSGSGSGGNKNTKFTSSELNHKAEDKTKTVTVFSQHLPQRRDSQENTELPSYVKKMMEKDASLRRLLKTGSVTISQINQPSRSNQKGITNITITKTSTGGLIASASQQSRSANSNGSGLCLPDLLSSSQPIPSTSTAFSSSSSSVISTTELDWSSYPAALKFLELVKAAQEENENNEPEQAPEIFNVPSLAPPALTPAPIYRGTSSISSTSASASSSGPSRQLAQHRLKAPKLIPSQRALQSQNKFVQPNRLPTIISQRRVSTPSFANPSKLTTLKAQQQFIRPIQKGTVINSKAQNAKNSHGEDEIDPTRFLEVSLLEEDHTALSDEHRRKYKCPHCPKAFCWSTDLKRHILTHTGERPFKCIYCSANFTRKFLMQKHVRKYHPDFDCEDAVPSSGKSHNLGGVSNGKKSGMNGYFNNGLPNPIAKAEVITAEDYEEEDAEELYANSAPPAPLYKFNHGRIMFKEEMYADQDGEAEDEDEAEVATSMGQHSMYNSSTPYEEDEDGEMQEGMNCKDEMLDEEDDDEYMTFPDPTQFLSEEMGEEDDTIDEVQDEGEIEEPHSNSLQKYSLGRNFINANSSSSSGAATPGSSSSPIIINVFSSNTPISEQGGADGSNYVSAETAATAPRRLSQSLVNQLARANAKLKGDMAKTTSAREALRLLVRR